MKVRIRFTKLGSMRFIGHLDLMRYFQKVMRRAKVDIRYSEGFSPHQIMSFAAPLGLGVTSDAEYVDIDVLSTEDSVKMTERLNAVSNDEIRILSYRQIPDDSKSSMSLIAASDYIVAFREPALEILKQHFKAADEQTFWMAVTEKLAEFYAQEEILITKKTKKSEKEADIRPLIYQMQFRESAQSHFGDVVFEPCVFLRTSTGSEDNLKPELVMQAFFQYLGLTMPEFALQIHRMELYGKDPNEEGKFLRLEDFGWELN
ncbi:MAG: DUF2344 domain-containing protein [Lachnospiraceae bacterium]|nr:DUF2344 domain-containing protein [Lachnospiraceae bacterium]